MAPSSLPSSAATFLPAVATTRFFTRQLKVLLLCALFWHLSGLGVSHLSARSLTAAVLGTVGPTDAVLLISPQTGALVSKNAGVPLVPASTLKLLTSLAALHYLGPDFRFKTDFFLDGERNLIIKGYGDPLLISEVLASAAPQLAANLKKNGCRFNDIIVDDSYFAQPLTIPGVTASNQPYDAPNGALCANFNTVYFRRDSHGRYTSAEPQTPLVSPALAKTRSSGLSHGRIILSHNRNDIARYAGSLMRYFLVHQGLAFDGRMRREVTNPTVDRRVYRLVSPFTLAQVISRLLTHSNNFMANQLLIFCGIAVYGPPGTLAKGVRAVTDFARNDLGIRTLHLTEGSGISRDNRISAEGLMKILARFEPYRQLMRQQQCDWHKTGTLKGIRTRAGYLVDAKQRTYRYVLMFNTAGKSPQKILKRLRQTICGRDTPISLH